ncbi:hypothetical protein CMI37_16870 [Candidatus Pacearchaeota archaeon]|nr:hypothetical protein [Candidatus Pacearchaeota archaeon]
MSFYKFGPNDLFFNVIKTYPKCSFFIYSGSLSYNNQISGSGQFGASINHVPSGHISLHEVNVDRPSGQLIYPFISKNSTHVAPRTVSAKDYNGTFSYGDELVATYPLSASIVKTLVAGGSSRNTIVALRNSLDFYTPLSRHYAYTSSYGDKSTQTIGLVSIPSIFYGSSIKKGTVGLKYYLTGTLIAELKDEKRNGELVQTGPYGSTGTGSVAGVVLYNEGFLLLTGSWALDSAAQELYNDSVLDNPKWIHFAQSISGSSTVASSSFNLEFNGTNPVPVRTLLAHAPIGELNHSSNPTYIEHGQALTPISGTYHYTENDELRIKNVVSSAYADPTGSFRKTTFISKIGIYDEKKNLIGIAKLATPVKKTEDRDFTFKLKLDF